MGLHLLRIDIILREVKLPMGLTDIVLIINTFIRMRKVSEVPLAMVLLMVLNHHLYGHIFFLSLCLHHLKFFCNRIINNTVFNSGDDDEELNKIIKQKYKKDYKCAEKIKTLIKKEYKREMTEEEMTFLTIHLKRISQNK